MLINDPNHNFSDFSKTTNESSGMFGVPTVFETSVSHVSHDASGNRCKTERRRGKTNFCDRCCRVDVKEKSTEQELFSSDSETLLF